MTALVLGPGERRSWTAIVVGAGPAGLSAAIELAGRGVPVVVLEREGAPGGVPRHCDHQGFGLQDLRRSLTGPRYAERLVARALERGVEIWCSTTVTDLHPGPQVSVVGPRGMATLSAQVVVVATGVRERPRSARLVPGDRPAGISTTGQLQQMVAAGLPVGTRALVVGAEHVSYSAALLLRHAGVDVVAMTTELPRHQSVAGLPLLARLALGTRVRTSTRVAEIVGRGRVEAVLLEDLRMRRIERLAVDTVVFTGDWIPDAELVRRAGATVDPATRGPEVDGRSRSSLPGVLVAGNLVHPAETGGTAALHGRAAGASAAALLHEPIAASGVRLEVDGPLRWVWPGRVAPDQQVDEVIVWTDQVTRHRTVVIEQDGRELFRHRLRHAIPNRSLRLPGRWTGSVDLAGGAVRLRLE